MTNYLNIKELIREENSKSKGYCIEKIVEAFASNTIPIYYGDPTVKNIFNERSFIYVENINDFDKAITEIQKIDNDDNIYKNYLKENALNDIHYIEKEQEKFKCWIYNIFEKNISSARRNDNDNLSLKQYKKYLCQSNKICNNFFVSIYIKLFLKNM